MVVGASLKSPFMMINQWLITIIVKHSYLSLWIIQVSLIFTFVCDRLRWEPHFSPVSSTTTLPAIEKDRQAAAEKEGAPPPEGKEGARASGWKRRLWGYDRDEWNQEHNWLVVSNIFYVRFHIWDNHPNWRTHFSEGMVITYLFMGWLMGTNVN